MYKKNHLSQNTCVWSIFILTWCFKSQTHQNISSRVSIWHQIFKIIKWIQSHGALNSYGWEIFINHSLISACVLMSSTIHPLTTAVIPHSHPQLCKSTTVSFLLVLGVGPCCWSDLLFFHFCIQKKCKLHFDPRIWKRRPGNSWKFHL